MPEVRNSNHELMRIISMFLIVLGHILLFGGLLDTTNPSVSIIYNFLEFILIMHVNSFVLVSGYYQSEKKFKQKNLWKIINACWFYRVVIMLIFSLFGIMSFTKVEILENLNPIILDNYWFIRIYLIMYCLSPFINKLINSLDKKSYKKLLLVGFLAFSILPTVTEGRAFENNGYTLYNFIYLYLVGAYLKLYPLDKSYHFKRQSTKLFRITMLTIVFTCAILNNIIFYFGKSLIGTNSILEVLSSTIIKSSLNYSNPLIIIQSIAYFSFFTVLNLKSKIINKCSSLMFGVYLIHANPHIHVKLYSTLNLTAGSENSISFMPYVFLMVILVFTSCTIIEYFRQLLFKFISTRKVSIKIREKYYNSLSKIFITD